MREFINDFGKSNFLIIAIVVLVILIALVLLIILERYKVKKQKKIALKEILKANKDKIKDRIIKKEEPEKPKQNNIKQETNNIEKPLKKINKYNPVDAIRGLEKMEDTLKYELPLIKKENIAKKPRNDNHKQAIDSYNTRSAKKREEKFSEYNNHSRSYQYKNIKEEKVNVPINRSSQYKNIRDEKVNISINKPKEQPNNLRFDKNIAYTNVKPRDEVVYKENTNTKEAAKEKLEEVTKKLITEQNEKDHITVFEAEQEEKSIISYDELVKASKDIDEKNDRLLEDEMEAAITLDELYKPKKKEITKKPTKIVETKKSFTNSKVISPVFGTSKIEEKKSKENYRSITEEDNEVFLEKLRNFRNNLE